MRYDYEAQKKYLDLVEQGIAEGPYRADWASLSEAGMPEWFGQEKFGIFMHWGLYSVPASQNEWYSRNMYIQGDPAFEHHVKTYGPQKEFGYKDFIPLFQAEHFDPKEWIRLFREAGAGYIFPVAEHHDGFQMYDSELSEWNAKQKGPKRDILGDLKAAAEEEGLQFCCSSHRAEHWFFMSHGKEFDSDIREPLEIGDFYWPAMPERGPEDLFSEPAPTKEYLDDWLARTAEIIVKYRPSLLYFDWWIQHEAFKPYLKKLAAFYYNCGVKWGRKVQICYKHDAFAFGTGIVEVERGGFAEAKPYKWQTDTAVARNSWCYTDTLDYKSSYDIVCNLIDVVSKNGNLLLNIGPKADGTIPEGDRRILEDLAAWMKVNHEAIKGTGVWRKSMEGEVRNKEGQFQDAVSLDYTSSDYRFTAGHGNIYAICMRCPKDGQFLVRSLADSADQNVPEFHGIIGSVEILGYDGAVNWSVDKSALKVSAPGVSSDFPVTLRIRVK
ncbi:MAG: alpha-L-fucosidase [Lachnospiraceae bacterium]|nr:alpha-L-fucosidase [Lachnospiraceae bacterium]